MKHILIIEDDTALNNGIVLALKDAEYRFFQATTLASAKELMLSQKMAMVILDINLPDGNGFEFLEAIRKESEVPVIILTANDMELDEVRGLNLGADDYITKPFSLMVLRSRIESVFRRSVKQNKNIYVIDDLYLDFEQMFFKVGDRELVLSKTEQKLLHLLLENKDRTVARRTLVDKIWTNAAEYVDENALSVAISRLRNKIEKDPGAPQYIQTVYGLGYTWGAKA
ncbi:response regulator transcription factor [Acetobacterium sp.]|jgi:DNA-binding response OmpR family regulator|uniref:response regulator transcription factor n=1 Tax=Acetobacterium sp. TaxID=1872094 RepID=UPI000CB803B2|nr:response regulator transcription factor [Acetobacterium sp.]MDO9493360.1 response regulator transcription factor [Acetobacterium sp.]PKM73638.1 MAG: DNA-binding response regulator [Firmicutes bacterium HGW-Firmicutes-17]